MTWDTLVGQAVGTGWQVTQRKAPKPGDSGSNFSVGFIVEKDGKSAFMKVFDLDRLVKRTSGNLKAMRAWIELFEHECKLLEKCRKANTTHVISVIELGKFKLAAINPTIEFQFFICELADNDLRHHYNYSAAIDLAFALAVAKHVAQALGELHGIDISHQDVKPSNVLLMKPATSTVLLSKMTDLGSASSAHDPVWHDARIFWGDPAYAPPEALYNQEYPSWCDRRIAKDLWMLGSLIVFLITKVNLTAQVISTMPPIYQPAAWADPYQNVLPVLENALNRVLVAQPAFSSHVGVQLRTIIKELCNPNPLERGSPRILGRPQKYSMQRYVSVLDRLLRYVLIFGDS